MAQFVVSPEAEDDIFQIWRYLLVEADILTANRIEEELLDAFSALARSPGQGHKRSDLTSLNVRFYTLYQYMVVYRAGSPVQILGVLHGKRDVKRILATRL